MIKSKIDFMQEGTELKQDSTEISRGRSQRLIKSNEIMKEGEYKTLEIRKVRESTKRRTYSKNKQERQMQNKKAEE